MYQTGQQVPLACGHTRTAVFNDSHSPDAQLWCGPCDGMRSPADYTPVRYVNTRAVAAYAARLLAAGEAFAVWPSDTGRALWVAVQPDAGRTELGLRADTYDDFDAWLWCYPVTRSDRSDNDLIAVDLETWIHVNTRHDSVNTGCCNSMQPTDHQGK